MEPRTEFFDSREDLVTKYDLLKNLTNSAGYIVFYTGAGISTNAHIPDYSGDEGLKRKPKPMVVLGLQEAEMDLKMPTFSHSAIAEMQKRGIIRFVITSNHDNLHQKAGIDSDFVSDLFGNVYVEKCSKCRKNFPRKVIVPSLGRICDDPECGGRLMKTEGTRMGAMTPEEPLEISTRHSKMADLGIVLGSSMSVSPFCDLAMMAKKTVICTLQSTSYDSLAHLKIHDTCDNLMRVLCRHFGIEIADFTYRFVLVFERFEIPDRQDFILIQEKMGDNMWGITVDSGRDKEPCTCVDKVTLDKDQELELQKDRSFFGEWKGNLGQELEIEISFKPQYSEPPMNLKIKLEEGRNQLRLEFTKKISF